MRKRVTKRILCLCAVCILCVALSLSAFAASRAKTGWRLGAYGDQTYSLSVYGNTVLSPNRNVVIYQSQNITDQLWIQQTAPNGLYYLVSGIDGYGTYALNIYRYQGANYLNCDVYPLSGNERDASIEIQYEQNSSRHFKSYYYGYYLVATGASNLTNVKWGSRDYVNYSDWWFPVSITA